MTQDAHTLTTDILFGKLLNSPQEGSCSERAGIFEGLRRGTKADFLAKVSLSRCYSHLQAFPIDSVRNALRRP